MARPLTIAASAQSHQGRVREHNEDACAIVDLTTARHGDELSIELGARGVLLAVADGVGGTCAGEVASALAVETLRRELENRSSPSPMQDLDEAVLAVDRVIRRVAFDSGRHRMATTITAALIVGKEAYLACVGDSRAYLIRGDHIVRLTSDQNYAAALVQRGDLDYEEARRSPLRHRLLQALGADVEVEAECRALDLCRGDVILLCSDGLSGCIHDREILEYLNRAESPGAAVTALVALANDRGGSDNITVALARIEGESLPEIAAHSDPFLVVRTMRAFDFASSRWWDTNPDFDQGGEDVEEAHRASRFPRVQRLAARVAAAVVAFAQVISDYFQ